MVDKIPNRKLNTMYTNTVVSLKTSSKFVLYLQFIILSQILENTATVCQTVCYKIYYWVYLLFSHKWRDSIICFTRESQNYINIGFHVKCMFHSSLFPFVLQEVHVLFMLFVFIYIYRCPARFPYQMMLVTLKSNTTGVACGAGSANPSGASEFTRVFSGVHVA